MLQYSVSHNQNYSHAGDACERPPTIAEKVGTLEAMQPHSGSAIFKSTAINTALGAAVGFGLGKLFGYPKGKLLNHTIDTAIIFGAINYFIDRYQNHKIHDIKRELDAKYGAQER